MIRTLIIEHSTWPITPFIWRLFDFYQATLWERLPSDTFEGYDFRVACSAAEPMRLLIESNPILAKRLSLDSVLLPGPTWKNLAPAEEPAKQVFRLRYSLCGTVASLDSIAGLDTSAENWHGFVIDARNSPLWMKHVSREQRSAQEGLFLERVNDEFGRNQLEMRPGPLTVGFAGSVYFVGRLSDDEDWIENPRARYPMRYTVRPRHRPGQSPATELHEFRRFPSNARLQYFGPEFRPV